ncbi:MAG: hypothetical protein A2Z34_10875 [Planctomycetes bacterium RBG_16_59_8]|nr:MAG: hypothetical protein A2Z34_10875 [Planctomycetes bacterium RBG_16_59_8]
MSEQWRKEQTRRSRERKRMFWQFELNLSRALLMGNPSHLNALQMLGNALTRTGRHDEALGIDKKLTTLVPSDPIAHYNLACSYAAAGDPENAVNELIQAVKLGYRDFKFMMRDPDLKSLRDDPRFRQILGEALKKVH